jgi:hypothetical protein
MQLETINGGAVTIIVTELKGVIARKVPDLKGVSLPGGDCYEVHYLS